MITLQLLNMHISYKCILLYNIDPTITIPVLNMVSKLIENNPRY